MTHKKHHKLAKRRHHQREQKHRKLSAVRQVMDKLAAAKKRGTQKQITEGMRSQGYIPNGRGGWRRLSDTARNPSNPTLDKS